MAAQPARGCGMRLERYVHRVNDIAFGPRTVLANGRLQVDRQALVDLVLADDRVAACNVELEVSNRGGGTKAFVQAHQLQISHGRLPSIDSHALCLHAPANRRAQCVSPGR